MRLGLVRKNRISEMDPTAHTVACEGLLQVNYLHNFLDIQSCENFLQNSHFITTCIIQVV
jgi:hypothetical protein